MKRIISSIILSFAILSVYADTTGYVYTPKGSSVEVIYRTEISAAYIADLNTQCTEGYPNATFVSTASATYNCHAYAWHMTEGGSACWINAPLIGESTGYANLGKYWTDGSYSETTEANATKVFYYNSDHSAVIKTAGSVYISKWGAAPLMEHAPGYGPYDDMVNRRYYKRVYYASSGDDDDDDEEEDDYTYTTGSLVPGDIFPRNVEFEFTQGSYAEEDYTYEWSVDEDGEFDAVANGKVTLNIKDNPLVAYVTFLTQGIFNVNLAIYDDQGRLRGNFTSQAIVQ